MVEFGDENGDARFFAGKIQFPLHLEFLGDWRELLLELRGIKREARQVPFHAHEEQILFGILMLVCVQDVGVVPIEKVGDCRNQTFAVGTIDQQGGGVFHRPCPYLFEKPAIIAASCKARPVCAIFISMMNKQWPYFLLFFLLPLLLVFWWWGAFSTPEVVLSQREGVRYAYLPSEGDYSKVEEKQKEVGDLLRQQGIRAGQAITLIESDPRTTPGSKRRAQAGIIIETGASPAAPLLTGNLPPRKALVVSARAHPFLAYGKAYGALLDYLKAHGKELRLPVAETTRDNTLTIEMTPES